MITEHTTHMSANELTHALSSARPGETIIYATGDLGYSVNAARPTAGGADIILVRRMVWEAYERGELFLTQRRTEQLFNNKGAAFEYRATKKQKELL